MRSVASVPEKPVNQPAGATPAQRVAGVAPFLRWQAPPVLPRQQSSLSRTGFLARPDGPGSPSYLRNFLAGVITSEIVPADLSGRLAVFAVKGRRAGERVSLPQV